MVDFPMSVDETDDTSASFRITAPVVCQCNGAKTVIVWFLITGQYLRANCECHACGHSWPATSTVSVSTSPLVGG